jgi:hypothetical protein
VTQADEVFITLGMERGVFTESYSRGPFEVPGINGGESAELTQSYITPWNVSLHSNSTSSRGEGRGHASQVSEVLLDQISFLGQARSSASAVGGFLTGGVASGWAKTYMDYRFELLRDGDFLFYLDAFVYSWYDVPGTYASYKLTTGGTVVYEEMLVNYYNPDDGSPPDPRFELWTLAQGVYSLEIELTTEAHCGYCDGTVEGHARLRPVPEPSSIAMAMSAMCGLLFFAGRRLLSQG